MAPASCRTWIYYHLYRSRKDRWPGIYESAELHTAPGIFMKLSPTDEGHGLMAFGGIFEWPLTKEIVRLGRQGGVMVDVGANYGYFSLIWAAQNPSNRVIAFEASPRNHSFIFKNIERNNLGSQISLRSEAVGREAGQMSFLLGPESQTGWGGLIHEAGDKPSATVPVVTLDETLTDIPFIDVLKIDTEGADTWVLEGAKTFLKQQRLRNIFFEEHRGRMQALGIESGRAQQLLKANGYNVAIIDGGADEILTEFHAYIE